MAESQSSPEAPPAAQPAPSAEPAAEPKPAAQAEPQVDAKAPDAKPVPPDPNSDDLRKRLQASSAKARRELKDENARLEGELEAAQKANADLLKRVEAIERTQTKAAEEKRTAGINTLLDAAKIKPGWRRLAHADLAELSPSSKDAAAKIDEWAKANPDAIDAPPLASGVQSAWLPGSGAPVIPIHQGAQQRPTGRDFMPIDRLPNVRSS